MVPPGNELDLSAALSYKVCVLRGGPGSAEQIIKFVVRADPDPGDRITVALTDGPVLFVDPYRPDACMATQLLEPQCGVIWILRKEILKLRAVPTNQV